MEDFENIDWSCFNDYTTPEDIHRVLILQILYQAVKDFLFMEGKERDCPIEDWYTARDFLFDDDYLMDFPEPITPRALLDIVDIEIDWVRAKVMKRRKQPRNRAQGPLLKTKEL